MTVTEGSYTYSACASLIIFLQTIIIAQMSQIMTIAREEGGRLRERLCMWFTSLMGISHVSNVVWCGLWTKVRCHLRATMSVYVNIQQIQDGRPPINRRILACSISTELHRPANCSGDAYCPN